MRKPCLILLVVMLGLTSCMDTYYMTRRITFDNAISSVRDQMADEGFYFNGSFTNTRNEPVVMDVSYSSYSGYGTAMGNNYITQDTYRFADSLGNTISYSVAYSAKMTVDGVPYVEGVGLCGCETSNPKDYETFCGDESVVKQFNDLPKDQLIKKVNVVNTTLAVTGIILSLSIVIAMFSGLL